MTVAKKRICILGSTGSIGRNALRVIDDYPDRFEAVGLAAHASGRELSEQIARSGAKFACLADSNADDPEAGGARVFRGTAGLIELIDACEPDMVVVATVGYAGLAPTLHAVARGATVALANKEVLVTAGELVMETARRARVAILPIDSEHNAIFQCLGSHATRPTGAAELRRIILTASGGPFRGKTRAELEHVTIEQALAHPTWQMGRKITIDSATLMNKGLEVIETHHLFGEPVEKIEVVVHPQSVIHGMIEYADGSMLAQLGATDMYLPIANVLAWPERLPNSRFAALDLAKVAKLTFEAPDLESFPCLRLACDAIRAGGTYPTALNAANEVAVAAFLEGRLRFTEIAETIERALESHASAAHPDLAAICAADAATRRFCAPLAGNGAQAAATAGR